MEDTNMISLLISRSSFWFRFGVRNNKPIDGKAAVSLEGVKNVQQ